MRRSALEVRTGFAKGGAVLAVALGLLSSPGATASERRDRGLLLLYPKAQETVLEAALPRLEVQGCGNWRRGAVTGTRGNLKVGSPDRFVLLLCSRDVLDSAAHRRALAPLLALEGRVRAVEGPILQRGDEDGSGDAQKGRAYVIKISRYRNLDPDRRESDLAEINALADERADSWKTEALVRGASAVGMPTPDEVVVIHYETPEQGKAFRRRNPDILERIGAFNGEHLLEFVYISATVDG